MDVGEGCMSCRREGVAGTVILMASRRRLCERLYVFNVKRAGTDVLVLGLELLYSRVSEVELPSPVLVFLQFMRGTSSFDGEATRTVLT